MADVLAQVPRTPQIEIEALLVAPSFGLHPLEFRKLLQSGKIATLCERGTGEDSGTYRISFYHQRQRARLVIAADGGILSREVSTREARSRTRRAEPPIAGT